MVGRVAMPSSHVQLLESHPCCHTASVHHQDHMTPKQDRSMAAVNLELAKTTRHTVKRTETYNMARMRGLLPCRAIAAKAVANIVNAAHHFRYSLRSFAEGCTSQPAITAVTGQPCLTRLDPATAQHATPRMMPKQTYKITGSSQAMQ